MSKSYSTSSSSSSAVTKSYIIVHDGARVLIGMGGRCGPNRNLRSGFHLPGGTIDKADIDARGAALRELEEEAGIRLPWSYVTTSFAHPTRPDITFVVAKVGDVSGYVDDHDRPDITNPNDEPFKAWYAIEISECVNDTKNFVAFSGTDWFGEGIREAVARGFLK